MEFGSPGPSSPTLLTLTVTNVGVMGANAKKPLPSCSLGHLHDAGPSAWLRPRDSKPRGLRFPFVKWGTPGLHGS
jgi:hypothetical protein